MKYRQLTKEQFKKLHKEFIFFLSLQSIDKNEWNKIKNEKPNVADDVMNIFSDMVWQDVLTKINYIDHYSKEVINLFRCDKKKIVRIIIKVTKKINLLEMKNLEWVFSNLDNKKTEILVGEKKYYKERNIEIFDLIEKGGIVSKGEYFKVFEKKGIINNKN